MNKKEIEEWTKSVQEKIGKEASGKIADDLGKLLTDNAQMNEIQTKQNKQIKDLEDSKEKLLSVNANLLQQVSMGDDEDYMYNKQQKEEKSKKISYKECFDEKGNFKI